MSPLTIIDIWKKRKIILNLKSWMNTILGQSYHPIIVCCRNSRSAIPSNTRDPYLTHRSSTELPEDAQPNPFLLTDKF